MTTRKRAYEERQAAYRCLQCHAFTSVFRDRVWQHLKEQHESQIMQEWVALEDGVLAQDINRATP